MENIASNEKKAPKVLMLNGSPHAEGTTWRALKEIENTLNAEGVEVEYLHVGAMTVTGCTGCYACGKLKKCVHDDIVNDIAEKLREADGLVLGSPVYYASPNGAFIALLDRLFYSSRFDKSMKVGASVVAARRGGLTASFDMLNKYFAISEMPIATSKYWNQLHGNSAEEAEGDLEGLQSLRTLARNMAFLIKCIKLGKEQLPIPEKEKLIRTNFIR